MEKVDFFTAVSFGNQPKSCSQSLIETVDSYFYLGGKKAYVIPGHAQQGIEGAVLTETENLPAFLITALKVVSYLTIATPVVMLIAKAIIRSIHSFHIVDVTQKLEEGIVIPENAIEKIRAFINRPNQNDPEIVRYTGQSQVFSFTSVPNLIFKSVNDPDKRFKKMVKAQEVCLAHQLGLLIIPHAKKFVVDGKVFIAEQLFNVQHDESAQEELYSKLSGLEETTRQLATFIAKTGFSDVEWRNMPIIDDQPSSTAPRRVALVDLEEMESSEIGIFGGGLGRRGLIGCLFSTQQIDIALAEADRHGIVGQHVAPGDAKKKRTTEVENYKELQLFYRNKGILENPRKPIQVDDLSTLGLNLDESAGVVIPEFHRNGSTGEFRMTPRNEVFILKNAVVDVIAQINDAINKTPKSASIKGKRNILLRTTDNSSLQRYHQIGLTKNFFPTAQKDEPTWLRRIINALVDKGHLFKLVEVNDYGYFIQA